MLPTTFSLLRGAVSFLTKTVCCKERENIISYGKRPQEGVSNNSNSISKS